LPRGFEPFLGIAGPYKQPVQYGKGPPIKAAQPEPSPHLETACEIHHIYEDLNESSSARPGRSQQLEIPPSLNSKQAACFFLVPPAFLWPRVFHQERRFQRPQKFYRPPVFQQMQGFLNPPVFSKRKDFSIRLLFQQKQGFLNPPDFQ